MIRVSALNKAFGVGEARQVVLRDVSFVIPDRSVTAIVGRSGSGKTTLLNLLAGLDTADAGEINIDGTSLSAQSQETLARFRLEHIGLVFQFFNLLPTLTLQENVALASYLAGEKRKVADEKALALLTRVGLSSHGRKLPHEVSGGEIQRAAIARALINEPKILFADEPTGNLDRQNAASVMEIFYDVTKSTGATLVVVSHDPLIEKDAEQVLRLVDGAVVP